MAQHPLYGSIKLGEAINKAMPEVEAGKDGGIFNFGRLPLVSVSTGAAGVVSTHQYDDGLKLYWSSLGTNTIGNQPLQVAAGMNYQYDNASNEGWNWSLANSLNKSNIDAGRGIERYLIGSDAFYARLTFSIADVSNTDDTFFGFRKVQAPVAIDSYTDVASIGIITSANPAAQQICTALNNAAMTETDTTDTLADGVVTTWEVYVSSAGVVTYKIDGAAPSTTATFTFDSGDYVTPFMHMLGAGAQGAVTLISLDHGRQ